MRLENAVEHMLRVRLGPAAWDGGFQPGMLSLGAWLRKAEAGHHGSGFRPSPCCRTPA